ncbi:hypothetical protein ACIBHX_18360 [Nonomuraea sp. NPDC050536]|uniref:hypothetical protein n=1 Tax=Nonomuraea sp. NPDC050536 TaxID=3364366 RepID=UPI0037CC214A
MSLRPNHYEGLEMTSPRRRLAIAVATLTIATLSTTACGAIGNKVDCAQVSGEVQKISQEFSGSITKAATDPKALETASQDASGKLKSLASKYDGDLAGALNDLGDVFGSIKVGADPATLSSLSGKIQSATTKIQSACG